MANELPLVLNNFKVYTGEDGAEYRGAGNIELPEIVMLTNDVDMAGIAGKISMPLTGHTDSLKTTITASVATIQAIKAAIPMGQMITARGALQVYDVAAGVNTIQAMVVVMRGAMSSLGLGQMKRGEAMDTKLSFELDYLKVDLNGENQMEIDKFNMVFIVNGTDYLADVKNAI